MSYITVEVDIDLDDYLDEIIYKFKNSNDFRNKLLIAMKEKDVKVIDKNINYDERCVWINKILINYWKLSEEENDLIKKLSDKF